MINRENMKDFWVMNIKEFLADDNIAIFCETEKLADELRRYMVEQYGFRIYGGFDYSKGTCYYSDRRFSSLDYATSHHLLIYNFKGIRDNLLTLKNL